MTAECLLVVSPPDIVDEEALLAHVAKATMGLVRNNLQSTMTLEREATGAEGVRLSVSLNHRPLVAYLGPKRFSSVRPVLAAVRNWVEDRGGIVGLLLLDLSRSGGSHGEDLLEFEALTSVRDLVPETIIWLV